MTSPFISKHLDRSFVPRQTDTKTLHCILLLSQWSVFFSKTGKPNLPGCLLLEIILYREWHTPFCAVQAWFLYTKAQLSCCNRDPMGYKIQKCTTWLLLFLKFQFYVQKPSFPWHLGQLCFRMICYLVYPLAHFIFSLIVFAYSMIVIPISLVSSWLTYLIG